MERGCHDEWVEANNPHHGKWECDCSSISIVDNALGFMTSTGQIISAPAPGYLCSADGSYEAAPRPGNTHGIYHRTFSATASTEEESRKNALGQCTAAQLDGCYVESCHQLVVLPPKPLDPDTEVSCADDSGIQIEILVGTPHYDRTAVITRNNTQIAAFGVQAYTPDNQTMPSSYESESSQYNMQLIPNGHLYLSGPDLYSDTSVRCISRIPNAPPGPGSPHRGNNH